MNKQEYLTAIREKIKAMPKLQARRHSRRRGKSPFFRNSRKGESSSSTTSPRFKKISFVFYHFCVES